MVAQSCSFKVAVDIIKDLSFAMTERRRANWHLTSPSNENYHFSFGASTAIFARKCTG
jgi:hypothetical protein